MVKVANKPPVPLLDENLLEDIKERKAWLESMGRTEAEVKRDRDGSEYVLSGEDDIHVYLPPTLQHVFK